MVAGAMGGFDAATDPTSLSFGGMVGDMDADAVLAAVLGGGAVGVVGTGAALVAFSVGSAIGGAHMRAVATIVVCCSFGTVVDGAFVDFPALWKAGGGWGHG